MHKEEEENVNPNVLNVACMLVRFLIILDRIDESRLSSENALNFINPLS